MKILLVEDFAELRLFWRAALEQAGHQVTEAAGYVEACEKMQQTEFSAILCDCLLSDGSGCDVAEYAGLFSPESEVVMTTGASIFQNGEIFEHCPNVSYLIRKPVLVADLLAVLGHCDRRARKAPQGRGMARTLAGKC